MGCILDQAAFQVWSGGRREWSSEAAESAKASLPVEQPAKVSPWLYVGDLHDLELLSCGKLLDRGIAAILSLCVDHMQDLKRDDFSKYLAAQGVSHREVDARDDSMYNILPDAVPAALDFVRPFYERGVPVLVHCYGGVNRAVAVSLALMMLLGGSPLLSAVRTVVSMRGKCLTNRRFRVQLVQLASENGLLGPGEDPSLHIDKAVVPPASWKTDDGTRLLELVKMSIRTGSGENLRDSKGYTLCQWEEWYALHGRQGDAAWMADRARAVRALLAGPG
jgi:hypothetical protein